MIAFEFSSKRTSEGYLFVPPAYIDQIPVEDEVRVIVLIEGNAQTEQPLASNGFKDHVNDESAHPLEMLVARIAAKPSDPANIHPASELLDVHLANPVTELDPSFDWKQWEQEWDRHEAKEKALARADQQEGLRWFEQ